MKKWYFGLAGLTLLLLSACGPKEPACPAGSITYTTDLAAFPAMPSTSQALLPETIEIDGRPTPVDRVIHGPLCNEQLSGTVYVACDLELMAWDKEKNPTFLENCDFTVEPGSVVYVAAHYDTAYYNGCSCHTGEIAEP
jgi:hypothetical protein